MKFIFRHNDWAVNLRDIVTMRFEVSQRKCWVCVRFFQTASDTPFEVLDKQVFEDMFKAWEALFVIPQVFQDHKGDN